MSILNLMPPEAKTEIIYARRNQRMLNWLMVSCCVMVGILATVVAGGFYIGRSQASLDDTIRATQANITTQKLGDVQKESESLSQGVKLLVQILSSEIEFSKLLKQVGAIMPNDTVMGNIQLSNKISGALDLSAFATTYQSATQVQVNLQDPKNALFDKVDTISVTCSESAMLASASGKTDGKYRCQIILRALFKKDAGVTFVNSGSAKP